MKNIQPLLVGSNKTASDISIYLEEDGQTLDVYLWISLLEKVPCDPDTLQYKMFVGRLYRMGFNVSAIAAKLGHDARTIKLWADALVAKDLDEVARIFAGRGGVGKVSTEMIRVVKWLYRTYRSEVKRYRKYISGLVQRLFGKKVSDEVLRRIFRAADAEDSAGRQDQEPVAGEVPSTVPAFAHCAASPLPNYSIVDIDDLETLAPVQLNIACSEGDAELPEGQGSTSENVAFGCAETKDLSSTLVQTRNWSPNFGTPLMPFSHVPVPREWMPLHHAGLALALPLLDHYAQGLAGHREVPIQMIGQLLQGAVNIEQGRFLSLDNLECFTGTSIASGDPQRAALDTIADPESVLALYALNARLLSDGPGSGDCFYLDPHCKKYTGVLDILRGWCGSQNGVAKVVNLDTIHTETGRACFVAHYDAYHDLRARFFMTLESFRKLIPSERQDNLTFVVDRGIFGLSTFDRFSAEKCRLITWEKGYERGTGWRADLPVHQFDFHRFRNDSKDLLHYHFECVEYPWSKRADIRRIIVQATSAKGDTIEVSVLCTHPEMSLEKVVRLIFNRWIQEGDFLMLVRHVGFNQLDSYKWLPYEKTAKDDGKTAVNPEYKKKSKEIREAEKRLAKMVKESRKLQKTSEQNPKAKIRHATRSATLETDISAADIRIEQLVSELHQIVKELPKQQYLAETAAVKLNTRRKSCFDALRITAANMTRGLLIHFRKFYDNRRNDMAILRMLLKADGFVRFDGQVIQIRLWLKGEYQPKVIREIEDFLASLSQITSSRFVAKHPPVRIALYRDSDRYLVGPTLPPL